MRHMKMKELPNSSRPYERCMREGAEHLTDAELLSIILRTGSKGENSLELAERILALNCPGEGILGLLHLSLPQLMSVKGIGKVKGVQLMCIGELSRRIWKKKHMERVMRFEEPEQVAAYYREDLRHMEQEQFFLMMFNTRQMLIGERMMSKGTVNASLAGTREIYIEALRYQAVSLILVHNQPQRRSGAQQRGYSINRTGSQGRRAYGDPSFGSYCDWRQRVCQYERTRIVINGVKTQ